MNDARPHGAGRPIGGDDATRIVVHAKPVDVCRDDRHVILPSRGHMGGQPVQHDLRIPPVEDAGQKPVIEDAVRHGDGAGALGCVVHGFKPFLVQDDAKIFQSHGTQALHRPAMRQQDKMHRSCGGADIAQARRMVPQKMRQKGNTPRLVDGGDVAEAVSKPLPDDLGKIGKMVCDVRIAPTANVGHPLWQLPVIKRAERFQITRQHGVNEPVVKG